MRRINLSISLLVAALTLFFASSAMRVYAQSEPSGTTLEIALIIERIVNVAIPAIVTAVAASGLGYLKNSEPGTFSLTKFTYTLLLAGVVAYFTSMRGMTYDDASAYVYGVGLTVPLYWVAQIVVARWGHLFPKPPAPD